MMYKDIRSQKARRIETRVDPASMRQTANFSDETNQTTLVATRDLPTIIAISLVHMGLHDAARTRAVPSGLEAITTGHPFICSPQPATRVRLIRDARGSRYSRINSQLFHDQINLTR